MQICSGNSLSDKCSDYCYLSLAILTNLFVFDIFVVLLQVKVFSKWQLRAHQGIICAGKFNICYRIIFFVHGSQLFIYVSAIVKSCLFNVRTEISTPRHRRLLASQFETSGTGTPPHMPYLVKIGLRGSLYIGLCFWSFCIAFLLHHNQLRYDTDSI